jgi:hypothetical protein
MKMAKFFILSLFVVFLTHCASNEPKPSKVPDVTETGSSPDAIAPSETNESDLQNMADESIQSKPSTTDEFGQNQPAVQAQAESQSLENSAQKYH